MNGQRLKRALTQMWQRKEEERWTYGLVGKLKDGVEVFDVEGRAGYIYVRVRSQNGAQTSVPARNDAGVAHAFGLAVRMRTEGRTLVIDSEDRRESLATVPAPSPSGVPVHTHDDRYFRENEFKDTSAGVADAGKPIKLNSSGVVDDSMLPSSVLTDTDDLPEGATNLYYTPERARDDVGAALVGGTGITVTVNDGLDTITIAGTVTAYTDEMARDAIGAALVAGTGMTVTVNDGTDTITLATTITQYTDEMAQDAVGAMVASTATVALAYVDATPALTATVVDDSVTNAKLANMAADTIKGRANGAGTGDPTDLTATQVRTIINVTSGADVTGTAITALATKTTPVDADAVVITDSAASDAPKRTLWSNVKATLKTYFDTLYGLLAGTNTWTGANTFRRAGVTVFDRTTAVTNALAASVQIWATSTGQMADNFGAGLLLLAQDADGVANTMVIFGGVRDGADNSGAFQVIVYTAGAGTERMRITTGGDIGFGMLAPQGKMHATDGVGNWMNVSKSGVAGTKVVIIADGTGDVFYVLTAMYALQNSDGTSIGGFFSVAPSGSFPVTIGGTTWTFSITAGGEFSVIRTSGADTANIVLTLNWR